jgi:hypothetical protein
MNHQISDKESCKWKDLEYEVMFQIHKRDNSHTTQPATGWVPLIQILHVIHKMAAQVLQPAQPRWDFLRNVFMAYSKNLNDQQQA